jgi:hypothetical protein
MARRWHFSESFSFWCLDTNGGEDSYLYRFSSYFSFPQCVMDMCSMCDGRGRQELFLCVDCKTF